MLTCPHISHQNGTREREHIKIMEMGLTQLAYTSMPTKYWDHNFATIVYFINKLPTSALPIYISPYLTIHQKKSNYASIEVFGCACYPHLKPYIHHKLEFRSTQGTYLGVWLTHKGHKFSSSKEKIFVSEYVTFNEVEFPWSLSLNNKTTLNFPLAQH